jgi:PAS domain S-box-containing protein
MDTHIDIRRVFDAVPGLFLILRADADFTIVGASDDYLQATHIDRGVYGRPLFEVFPDNPAVPEASGVRNLRASLQRVLDSRVVDSMPIQRHDVRLPAAEGGDFQERYWSPVNAPVLGDDGSVEFIVHRVEEAAAKANRNAIEILESITEGFFTLDRQWRFDYVNREAQRILGVEAGALPGRVIWQIYPGMAGSDFERHYRLTMERREKTSFTAFYADQGRWYEVTAFPAAEGISVYFRNVTEQRRLQAERESLIAASEHQRRIYEASLDSTPDFVYVFDIDHRALYANAALLKTWGVDDVRGKRWTDLGYEDWHAELHDRELAQVIRTRQPIRGEIPFTGTNGTRVYDYIFAPVLGADGEVVAVAGTTRDITERQAAERSVLEQSQRMAAADRAKDEFLATLSHELRNPLAPLRNAIELLRRTHTGDERLRGIHAIMERQIGHLIRLVDDLLDVARISSGAFLLQNAPVDLVSVIRHAVETSGPLLQAKNHRLDIDLPDELLRLEADATRLTQVLANLLNNAASYSEAGGRIAISAAREGQQAVIRVRDQGMGISPEALPRLFEMFNRGHLRDGPGSLRGQAGLGIGLALSRRLAEMHGGTLEAYSAGRGLGSEFTLRLPLPATSADGVAHVPGNAPDLELSCLRVLVVDDNEDAAETLSELLASFGAQVDVAHSGADGLRKFESQPPHLLFLDIGMPDMSGYEVAGRIRGGSQGGAVTLVALTGWGQQEDRDRVRAAGFDHHLVKPADLRDLKRVLAQAAARHASEGA